MKYSRVDYSTSNISLDIKEIIKNITHNYYTRYDSKTILKEENNTVDHLNHKHEKRWSPHSSPVPLSALLRFCNDFRRYYFTTNLY